MTWLGVRRKQLPTNWGTIRKLVLERDGYRCTARVERHAHGLTVSDRCHERATEVHHINGPMDHRLTSLASICHPHHQAETQAEAKAAQALKSRARPTAPHPGLR